MNPRQFFTTHHWWGKFIGGSLGYLILGPTGALFGILIGNVFDRGLTEHFTKPHWNYHAEKRKNVQAIFLKATFMVMGYVFKTSGRITEEQIRSVLYLMDDLQLNRQQKILAKDFFREGKTKNFDPYPILNSLRDATRSNPALLKSFIDIQYQAALVEGLSIKKQQQLNCILTYLGYAPLNEQYRFYEDFASQFNQQHSHYRNYSSTGSTYRRSYTGTEPAYNILGIPSTATKLEVKRAYRRLISRHHPDKLMAKGMPEAMIKQANEKTQQITKAYEQICEQRGW